MILRWKTPFYAARAFFRNGWRVITRQSLLVNKEECEKRLAICRKCTSYVADSNQCGICGCFVPIKTKLTAEICPHPDGAKW